MEHGLAGGDRRRKRARGINPSARQATGTFLRECGLKRKLSVYPAINRGSNIMTWLRVAGAGLLTLVLVVPASAQKDKKKDDKSTAEPLEAEKVLQPGKFSGKVAQASETSLQLRVDYVHYELN